MMKGRLTTVAVIAVVLTALLACSVSAQDHGIMVTALGGYQWGGTFKGYYGEARLNDAGNWGIALDIPVHGNDTATT